MFDPEKLQRIFAQVVTVLFLKGFHINNWALVLDFLFYFCFYVIYCTFSRYSTLTFILLLKERAGPVCLDPTELCGTRK